MAERRWRRFWPFRLFKRRRYTLLVMRLADMFMVHPRQLDTHACSQCGHQVGIYPSGQAVLRRYAGRVDIVCSRCDPAHLGLTPAPGVLDELFQSVPRHPPT